MNSASRLTAFAAFVAVLSSAASSGVFAANVQVTGAQDTPMAAGVDAKIATKDLLNNPTALVNKNTVAIDNNVFITRSNLLFSQNDRLGVMRAIEEFVEQAEPSSSMSTAVLSKDILKAISAPNTDTTMMSKASAVVASKGNTAALQRAIVDLMLTQSDRVALTSKIEALLDSNEPMSTAVLSKDILKVISAPDTDAAMMSKASAVVATKGDATALQRSIANLLIAKEKMIQAQTPPGVTLLVGTKDVLRQPRDSSHMSTMDNEDKYRTGFLYTKASSEDDKEQFGLWGAGLGFGWRYPLNYWNLYGGGLYGGGCGLGLGFGGFFYC